MSNNVAEASIVLNVDSSRLTAGMNRAAQEAKAKGAQVANSFQGLGGNNIINKIKGGGGGGGGLGLGGLFGGGLLIGAGMKALELGSKVIGEVVEGLYDAATGARAFHHEIEDGIEATQKWADNIVEGAGRAKEALLDMGDFKTTRDFQKTIGGNVAKLEEMKASLSATRKRGDELNESKFLNSNNFDLWIHGRLEGNRKKAESDEATEKAAIKALEKQEEELRRLQSMWDNPLTNPKAVTALKSFVRDIEDSTEDLARGVNALTAEEKQLRTIQRQFNFKGSDLAAATAAVNALKLANANKEAADWQKNLNNELLEQAGLIKDTAGLVKLDELIKKGADKAQIDRIRELLAAKQNLNRQFQPLQLLEKGTNAEVNFRRKLEFDQAKKDETLKLLGKAQLDELKKIATGIEKLKDEEPPTI